MNGLYILEISPLSLASFAIIFSLSEHQKYQAKQFIDYETNTDFGITVSWGHLISFKSIRALIGQEIN